MGVIHTQGFRSISESFTNFDLEDFNTRMKQLCQFSSTCTQEQKIICLEFDESAKRLWFHAANDLEANISETGKYQSVKDVVSKFMNNASRIAALFHFYLYGDETRKQREKFRNRYWDRLLRLWDTIWKSHSDYLVRSQKSRCVLSMLNP